MTIYFNFEWGGEASLTIDEIWPDGGAPENPTTDDVIAELRKTADQPRYVADRWNLDIEDIEVYGPGGFRSLARVVDDERRAAASEGTEAS